MKLKKNLIASLLALGLSTTFAHADVIQIQASQDATIGGGNNAWNIWYRWVGAGPQGYFSIFGFDVDALAGKTINSVSFTAYHNYTAGDDIVAASVGSDTSWNASTVTGYTAVGTTLDTQATTWANLNAYQTWNLGAQSLSGTNFTVALTSLGNGWNDYAPVASGANTAYLTVNYSNNVPEPATLGLMGLGVAGIAAIRRRAKANK